jgi:hypothetical protein
MSTVQSAEVVSDPVGHISISGVHGRDELNERLAQAPQFRDRESRSLASLLTAAVVGAALMYLWKR